MVRGWCGSSGGSLENGLEASPASFQALFSPIITRMESVRGPVPARCANLDHFAGRELRGGRREGEGEGEILHRSPSTARLTLAELIKDIPGVGCGH